MDVMQSKLIEMKAEQPNCMESRQKFKAVLSDYLPSNKREINLLLSAFDEDVVAKLSSARDATLAAIRFAKMLQNDCGMTVDASYWTIVTWCFLLGLNEEASALQSLSSEPTNTVPEASPGFGSAQHFNRGIYLAGSDFPAGSVKLESEYAKQNTDIYYAIIKKDSTKNEIITNGFFKTQVHLVLEQGQRLEIHGKVKLMSY